jgi:uncharacterized protein YukE
MKIVFSIIITAAAITFLPLSVQAESAMSEFKQCQNQLYAERKQLVTEVVNEYSGENSEAQSTLSDLKSITSEMLDLFASNTEMLAVIEQFERDAEDVIVGMLSQNVRNQASAAKYLQATKASIAKFLICTKL